MRSEIRSLTGLRGLSALWVMTGHYVGDGPSSETVRTVVEHMYLAVDLFMVLSGFVLARSHDADFRMPLTVGWMRRFLLRRIARIYPVYVLSSLVCLVLIVTGIDVWGSPSISWPMLLTNLAMAQSWGLPYDGLNAVSWSVSTEWAANLLFGLFGLLFMRGSLRRSTGAALLTLMGLVAFAALSARGGPDDPPEFGALTWYSFPGSMIRCTTEFMLGMFCWRLRRDSDRVAGLGSDLFLLPVVMAMAAMTLWQAMDLAFLLCGCAVVIGFSQERSRVARAFAAPLPRWLGTISFSMYLWHIPMLRLQPWIEGRLESLHVAQAWGVSTALLMLLVVGVSALSFAWIERPAQRGLQRLFAGWSGAVAPATQAARVSPSL